MEIFPLVDENGQVIGRASRKDCHSGTFLLHPVVHLHVFNDNAELYLQKRALNKDTQPGKWDTSVGGHVDYGESVESALHREAREELGIKDFVPVKMMQYKFISDIEAELVHSYYCIYTGDIHPDPVEISEGKYWKTEEIRANLGKDIFTPNFESEFKLLVEGNYIK